MKMIFVKQNMTFDDLPAGCIAEAGGIRLLVIGKTKEFGGAAPA